MHHLCVALARDPHVVHFARGLVGRRPARGRLARLTTAFAFVGQLVETGPAQGAEDGLDPLRPLLSFHEGPAVLLCALLNALGERAQLERTREMAFVRVELDADDVARLPPHADLLPRGRALDLPLDPREPRTPLGFLPQTVREALRRRGAARRA